VDVESDSWVAYAVAIFESLLLFWHEGKRFNNEQTGQCACIENLYFCDEWHWQLLVFQTASHQLLHFVSASELNRARVTFCHFCVIATQQRTRHCARLRRWRGYCQFHRFINLSLDARCLIFSAVNCRQY